MRRLLALLLLAGTVAGCAQAEPATQDIVSAVPWPDSERSEYVLVEEEGGDEVGRGTLEAMRQGERFELRLRFEGRETTDESAITVDARTLKPIIVRREIRTKDGVDLATGEYDADAGVVRIEQASDGDKRSGPRRLEDHYYDNESSLFLWRTIPFEEGYEASYHTVLVNRGSQPTITLEVIGREQVEVPAGSFDAWRLEVRSSGVRQTAWYADTPSRPLVQYDNSDVLFQLVEAP